MTVEELQRRMMGDSGSREQRRHPDDLLSVAELSEYLDVPPQTVYSWNYYKTGPPVLHAGRHVRYRQSDVDCWLAN